MKMRTVVEEEEAAAAAAAAVIVRWRSPYERVERMASGNAVVVFSVTGCCMCHVVKRLLLGLGVWPTVYELDQLEEEGGGSSSGGEIQAALAQLLAAPGALHMLPSASAASSTGRTPTAGVAAVPAVFVGGKLLGGVESLMACHINGALVPLLKKAGALWL